ncbi:MAG: hypothetical protein AAFP77_02505 [Bacteroidota bacterium]
MLRKLLRGILYLLFLLVATILLLEVSYRWNIVDFYGANLRRLNTEELGTKSDLPCVLVIGDSFSADMSSYVGFLRDSLREHRIINAAVPGTGVRQHQRFFKQRIREFQPEMLIYQLYVGNDLLDYRHPTSSPHLSWQRRWYWWLADRLLVLGYINAQLPAVRHALFPAQRVDQHTKGDPNFSVARYSERTKMLMAAEPHLLQHSILLQGKRKADMEAMTKELKAMLDDLPEPIPVLIVVMPHCVQVGTPFIERFQQLGAQLEDVNILMQRQFPFFTFLAEELDGDNVQVLNALDWLSVDYPDILYYANDPHLSPAGQKVVANSLLDSLRLQLD